MSREDICNVELVAAVEARQMLHAIAKRLKLEVAESDPHAPEAHWGDGWPANDARWTLTPHALQKLRPGKATARGTKHCRKD